MRIYFSGIGGVGLGPLAEIAADAGYDVLGSDVSASPTTEQLQRRGFTIHFDQSGQALAAEQAARPVDWFVYTSALPADHPELRFALASGIRATKRDELLAEIIKDTELQLIAVAGTHGKTTTTAMIVWLMQTLRRPVSYSIGAPVPFGPSGVYDERSRFFVYECDEYDRNFLHFTPLISVLPSVDYDHVDTYPTRQEYKAAFGRFVHQSDTAYMWEDTAEYIGVLGQPNVIALTAASAPVDGVELYGQHYRRNARLAAAAVAQATGVHVQELLDGIQHFPGTHRRFERLGDNLYSDYGHHPTEIAAVLSMAQEINDSVVLVYQPHQNSRQHELRTGYADALRQAQKIYWLPTYLSREDPNLPILSPTELIASLDNHHAAEPAELDDALWQHIQAARQQGSLVVVMGAGDVDNWLRDKLRANADA